MIKPEYKLELVLLFDLRTSCRPALELMHEHCEEFLKAASGNERREELLKQLQSEPSGWWTSQEMEGLPVEIKPENFRVKACGFAPCRNNLGKWLVDNHFVQETGQLQAQLSKLIGSMSRVEEEGSILEALLCVSGDTEISERSLIAPVKDEAWRCIVCFFAGQQQEGFEAVAGRRGMNPASIMALLAKRRVTLIGMIPELNAFWEILASLDSSEVDIMDISKFGRMEIMRIAEWVAKSRPSRRGWIHTQHLAEENKVDPPPA